MTNEAAERLYVLLTQKGTGPYADAPILNSAIRNAIEDIRTAERRATVERIRAAASVEHGDLFMELDPAGKYRQSLIRRETLDAILDAETQSG